MEIKIVQNLNELKELLKVFELTFEFENLRLPSNEHLESLLIDDRIVFIVAKINNQVIAGLSLHILKQYYTDISQAYIYDLAVLPEHQRKGIGQQLIAFTLEYCKTKGYEGTFVQAEIADDYAIEFYRKTKPSEDIPMVHFYYKL